MADESNTQEGLDAALEGSPEGSDQEQPEQPNGPDDAGQRSRDGASPDASSTSDEPPEGSGDEPELPEEIKNAPPEIRAELESRWKGLQSNHTKKRQGEVKEMTDLKQQVATLSTKAEAFDKLQNSPRFKAIMGEDPKPDQEEEQYYPIPEDATPETKAFYKDLNERLRKAEENGSKRALKEMQGLVRPLYQNEAKRMVTDFFKENPEATALRPRMAQIASEYEQQYGKSPTLPELYALAAAEDGTTPKRPPTPDTGSPEGPGASDDDAKVFGAIADAGQGDPLLRA